MENTIQIIIYALIGLSFVFDMWLSILNYLNRKAFIPEEVQDVYDPDKYKKWQEYYMESSKFSLIMKTINVIVFLSLLIFGGFVLFNDVAVTLSNNARIQVLIFIGLYYIVSLIIGLYPSYYDTFVIEEKYGFNKTTKKTFIVDKIKGFFLTIIFGGGLIYLLLVINDYAGKLFFIYAWVALVIIILLVNILYIPLIVPLFNKLKPLEDGEVKEAIQEFSANVGYEVTKISVIDASKRSSKLNAYFSGFGHFKKVVLYDTLLEKMSTEQIVAVLAHEIGHSKHKHIIFNLAQSVLMMLLYIGVFVLVLQNDVFSTAFGFESANFGFSIILFTVLLEPVTILLGLLTSTLSRKHEYQADYFASSKFSKHHMEQALKVLARENFANLTPHPMFVKLKYSHPPIVNRIREIRKVESN